jgi:transcriptional regulator with XRE-family HTH domain
VAEQPRSDGPEPRDEPPSRLGDLGAYIRHQRNAAQLSLRNLAKLAGVSNPYLSQIERGLRKPSAEILQAIAKALSISSETLYVKAGILEEREEDQDLESAIARDPHLTEPQRQALIEMYRSFRRLAELSGGGQAPGRGGFRGVLDAVSTGDVDDDAVRRASLPDEDDTDLAG